MTAPLARKKVLDALPPWATFGWTAARIAEVTGLPRQRVQATLDELERARLAVSGETKHGSKVWGRRR